MVQGGPQQAGSVRSKKREKSQSGSGEKRRGVKEISDKNLVGQRNVITWRRSGVLEVVCGSGSGEWSG